MIRDPEVRRAYQREYQRQRRFKKVARMIAHLGGQCVGCGTKEGLEIHHRNPGEKSFDPGSRGYPWPRILAELEKCELRCEGCHQDAHGRSDHGSLRMYKFYRCRCDRCVLAWRGWQRKYQSTDKYKAWANAYKRRKYHENRHGRAA